MAGQIKVFFLHPDFLDSASHYGPTVDLAMLVRKMDAARTLELAFPNHGGVLLPVHGEASVKSVLHLVVKVIYTCITLVLRCVGVSVIYIRDCGLKCTTTKA